jgi:hypothetical protein
MKNEALYRNFENIPSRKGRGGVYPYVRWQDVADRMNEVFGTNWSSEVLFQDIIGANVIVRVRVSIIDLEKGVFFTQEGFGGAPNDASSEAGTPFKSAYSKALKDACKKWGVGLYLDEDDDNSSISPLPSGYIGKEHGVPPMHMAQVANKIEEPIFSKAESPIPPVVVGNMSLPPGVGGSMPLPPGIDLNKEEIQVPKTITTPSIPQMPSIPPMPTPKVDVINTGEPDYISDVQRAALQSILSIKGVSYEPLAKEAFEFNGLNINPIPDPDKLSYQEAVYVIKYGNDKFRKR